MYSQRFYATVILYVFCSLLCEVEEDNIIEEYGLLIPILRLHTMNNERRLLQFLPEGSNV